MNFSTKSNVRAWYLYWEIYNTNACAFNVDKRNRVKKKYYYFVVQFEDYPIEWKVNREADWNNRRWKKIIRNIYSTRVEEKDSVGVCESRIYRRAAPYCLSYLVYVSFIPIFFDVTSIRVKIVVAPWRSIDGEQIVDDLSIGAFVLLFFFYSSFYNLNQKISCKCVLRRLEEFALKGKIERKR